MLLLGLWWTALLRPDWVARLAHPGRYPAAEGAPLAPSAYAAAARRYLAGQSIARVSIPRRGDAIVVIALPETGWGSCARTTLYLQPATARLLDRSEGCEGVARLLPALDAYTPPAATPLDHPALSPDHAVALAQAARGGRLVMLDWPTRRDPDWRVTLSGGPVAVADDGGIAVATRSDGGARLARRAVLLLAGGLPTLLALLGLALSRRLRSGDRRRPL